MKYTLIYITTKNKKEAEQIGRELVLKKLAACVNIFDNINSIYWWDDKIKKSKETVLIVKTRKSLTHKIIKKIKESHSYDCPCIISLLIADGNKEYLRWIGKNTK